MSWKGEKQRHSMSARGILTSPHTIAKHIETILPNYDELARKMNSLLGEEVKFLDGVTWRDGTVYAIASIRDGSFDIVDEYGDFYKNIWIGEIDFSDESYEKVYGSKGKKQEYQITQTRTYPGKEPLVSTKTGTLEELVEYYQYTLQVGQKYNRNINIRPTTFRSLLSNLKKAKREIEKNKIFPTDIEGGKL